jgi:glycosyltransferase involved in cell wall biosynthesis
MVDTERLAPAVPDERGRRRAGLDLPADALVVAMVNRLAPEKGLDVAIQGFAGALATLPPAVRAQMRLIIAGDGPLRAQVEADLRRHDLESCCRLWGEATPDEVAMLLGISDIFLYTGTRGINSMAVLEAMAAGCAVVASLAPPSLGRLLAEGRGIAIPPDDADAVGGALVRAATDTEQRRGMGDAARAYVTVHHSAAALRRCLLRVSHFAPELTAMSENDLLGFYLGRSEGSQ